MKKILFTLLLFISVYTTQAQIQHIIDGNQHELTEEISGKLSLYYTIIDGDFRYFIKKDGAITELKNSKDNDGKFQEEFKEILSIVTADAAADISKVNLTLASLKEFVDDYNKSVDINYKMQSERPKPKARLGAFVGASNNPFVTNPENKVAPIFGLDFEIYDVKRTRHSLFLGFKQSLKSGDFEYSSSQFGLGYRFRVINKESFSIYPQATFATYTFTNTKTTTVTTESGVTTTTTKTESGSSFDAPIILALGADIKLGNGFITLSVNELLAVVSLENQGNFPMDFRVGYKFNL